MQEGAFGTCAAVHGDIRHLEIRLPVCANTFEVHGDIRHLESEASA